MKTPYKELENRLKSQFRLFMILFCIAFTLIILFSTFFLIYANYFNKTFYTVLLCIIDSILALVCFIIFDFELRPIRHNLKHVNKINEANNTLVSGILKNITETTTQIKENISCYQLSFEVGKEIRIYYLNSLLGINLKYGNEYFITVANNFIKDIIEK